MRSCEPKASEPFLRIPPFPGARISHFASASQARSWTGNFNEYIELIRELRVGGSFWAAQPLLPARYVLVRTVLAIQSCEAVGANQPKVLWFDDPLRNVVGSNCTVVNGECDPWHMLSGADAVVAEADDEILLIAALLGVVAYSREPRSGRLRRHDHSVEALLYGLLPASEYVNPFTGVPMSLRETIELCGFWRSLIDSNRRIAGGLGFAFWKRGNVGALLWNGSGKFRFVHAASDLEGQHGAVAVWRARAPADLVAMLENRGIKLIEVEDGFIRSHGLGADCVPPLSITIDTLGAHFDPRQPSELERLLQEGCFDDRMIDRARRLRERIVATGIGKYELGERLVERPAGNRLHILVPGQVEDDRSVQAGGAGLTSNLELLRRVREQAPQAYILYKPHPDVVAGHRKGAIAGRDLLRYADAAADDAPISSLIAMVDEVHVNTSLAGFEALIRCKPVTTYGLPFYAGWGLTRDLGPVPARRTATRTLDELVAATYLVYPRYLDPVTGLPCPAEIVVERLCAGIGPDPSLLVKMRRAQGKVMGKIRKLAQ